MDAVPPLCSSSFGARDRTVKILVGLSVLLAVIEAPCLIVMDHPVETKKSSTLVSPQMCSPETEDVTCGARVPAGCMIVDN
jgi:hypothetical protein